MGIGLYMCASGEMKDDVQKLQFTIEALKMQDPFANDLAMHDDIWNCLEWQKSRTAGEIVSEREKATKAIESMGAMFRRNGSCDKWLSGADAGVAHIAKDVNGPLFEELIAACEHADWNVSELFRTGAPLYGNMQRCGMGSVIEHSESVRDAEGLWQDTRRSNEILTSEMRDDEHEDELHRLVLKDEAQGWMSYPVEASEEEHVFVRAVPGHGIAQGLKPDGSTKVRAVFNFSWCAPEQDSDTKRLPRKVAKARSINGCTRLPEKLSHDHIDDLIRFCKEMVKEMGIVPALFKADIASAFRRIPLAPEHQWAAGVMYCHHGRVLKSVHKSCPFGATSSVHNWERVGRFLRTVARKLLHIALFEYVDDYFAAERPEAAEHAMLCFARVVRAVLGKSAIAADKLMFGTSLEVLGVQIKLGRDRFTLNPCEKKMKKCLLVMEEALAEGGVLSPGCASKLAGRMQWGCQYMFRRLGRAMIRPIFAQCHARSGFVGDDLRVALGWWCKVLKFGIIEERFWEYTEAPLAHLFVDAAGKTSRYGHECVSRS